MSPLLQNVSALTLLVGSEHWPRWWKIVTSCFLDTLAFAGADATDYLWQFSIPVIRCYHSHVTVAEMHCTVFRHFTTRPHHLPSPHQAAARRLTLLGGMVVRMSPDHTTPTVLARRRLPGRSISQVNSNVMSQMCLKTVFLHGNIWHRRIWLFLFIFLCIYLCMYVFVFSSSLRLMCSKNNISNI